MELARSEISFVKFLLFLNACLLYARTEERVLIRFTCMVFELRVEYLQKLFPHCLTK